MFNRIDIISIPVKDQTASKLFYQDVLGFELVYEGQMGQIRFGFSCAPAVQKSPSLW